jgi:gliding motility-associated-like protein
MTKKLLAILALAFSTAFGVAQSLVPSNYQFFQGDTLNGFDMNAWFNKMGQYNALSHLNDAEKQGYMYRAEKEYVRVKYHLPGVAYKAPVAVASHERDITPHWMGPKNVAATPVQGQMFKGTVGHPADANNTRNGLNPGTTAIPCTNLDFEQQSWNNWGQDIIYASASTYAGVAEGVGFQGSTNAGINTCQHHILEVAPVPVPNDPFAGTPMVHPGGTASARLGGPNANVASPYNACSGAYDGPAGEADGEVIWQNILVTNSNCLLTYYYNVILADGGHASQDQPYFAAWVIDGAGGLVNCSQYVQACTNGVPPSSYGTAGKDPIDNTASVFYSGWQANSFDLSAYINNPSPVQIQFIVSGCVPGGHFGYAYVDGYCGPKQLGLSPGTACVGGTITVSAPPSPPGTTYSWTPGGATTSSINVTTTGTYSVTITPPAPNNTCPYTISSAVVFTPNPTVTATPSSISCNGGSNGSITATPSGGSGFNYNWTASGGGSITTGQGTATISNLPAGVYTLSVTNSAGCPGSTTTTITNPPALTSSLVSQTNVNCNGTATGSAQISASGGTGGLSYNWSPSPGGGQGSTTATGLVNGTYVCTITDTKGCTSTQSVTITQPAGMSVTPTQTNLNCNGSGTGSATVSVSGGNPGYTYNWTGGTITSGQGTATASGLAAGTYTCAIADANGCPKSQVFTISQPTALALAPTTTQITCSGANNGQACANMSGGTPGYSYAWSTGQTTNCVSGMAPGSPSVTVTDAKGCTATHTYNFVAPPAIVITAGATTQTGCGANTGTASANVSGGTPGYGYNWNPAPGGGQGTTNATGLGIGTYVLTVTDANSCTNTYSVNITALNGPTTTLGTTTQPLCGGICNGVTGINPSGGTGAYTYSWTGTATATTQNLTNLCPGTYTGTVTDAAGCKSSQTVTISSPPVLTGTATSTPATCGQTNGSATANPGGGSPGYTYSWNSTPAQTGITATNLAGGSYNVTITDNVGCTKVVTVAVTSPGAPTATSVKKDLKCSATCIGRDSATATGGGGTYTYAWTGPVTASTQSISNLCPGVYTCKITDNNNCSVTIVDTIKSPPAMAPVPNSTNLSCNGVCNGKAIFHAVGGTPGYTYSWTNSASTTDTASNLCPNTYVCTVKDANGCASTQSFTITQPAVLAATSATTNVKCNGGNTGQACVTPSGGTPTYTYAWTPAPASGQGTSCASSLSQGPITCVINDSKGCADTVKFIVNQPAAPLTASGGQTNATCQKNNGSVMATPSGGTSPYTYAWSNGVTTATNPNLGPGIFTCVVTDAQGCTSAVVSDTVKNIAVLPVAAITSMTPLTFCSGTTTWLVAAGAGAGGTYSWSTGSTADSIPVTTSGTVTLYATNVCGVDSSKKLITVYTPPVVTTTGAGSPICPNSSTLLHANSTPVTIPATTYAWTPGNHPYDTLTVSAPGSYTITATNKCGSTSSVVNVTQYTIAALFGANTYSGYSPLPVSFKDSSTASATSWSWNFGDGTTGSGQNPGHTFTHSGTYTVTETVTNANGCTATYSRTIKITDLPSYLDVPNVFTPNGDGSNDDWHVHYQGIAEFDCKIYDRWGVLITELTAPGQVWDGRTSGGVLCVPGTYYYILLAKGDDGKVYDPKGFLMLIRE